MVDFRVVASKITGCLVEALRFLSVVPYARPSSVRPLRPLSLTWKPIKMAEIVHMFLFLYKSKYRRKGQWRRSRRGSGGGNGGNGDDDDDDEIAAVRDQRWQRRRRGHGSDAAAAFAVPWATFLPWAVLVCCWVMRVSDAASSSSSSPTVDTACDLDTCVNGDCVNGSCVCREGWQGTHCQFCGGKVR